MTKIFSADYRSGTFIDSVNKIVGVPTSLSKLIRTEKGTALARVVNHAGVTYTTGSKSLSKFTIVAWIKQRTTDIGDRYCVAVIGNAQIIRREFSSTSYNNFFNSSGPGSISIPITTSLNKWMQFVVTYDGVNFVSSVNNKQIVGSPSATTATLDFTSIIVGRGISTSRYSDSDILKFDVYDDVISDKEIELDYKALLDTQITEKPVRGFEYPKPTDLSYLKDTGLVAAYNMKPNGNTLVDISGNGNNGTIVGALRTKDGMKFDGVDDYINCGKNVLTNVNKTQATWAFRINRKAEVSAATIISKYESVDDKRSWNIRELPSGVIGCTFSSNGTSFNAITSGNDLLENNKDLNIVMTFNAGQVNFYKNGVLHSTATSTQTSLHANTTVDAIIGYYSAYYNGEISDIRIYNRALSLQEVKDYHNSWVKPDILEDWSGSAVSDVI